MTDSSELCAKGKVMGSFKEQCLVPKPNMIFFLQIEEQTSIDSFQANLPLTKLPLFSKHCVVFSIQTIGSKVTF